MEKAVETLESQKEELSSSMDSSDYGTMVQREMMKIRNEGMMKENCVTDTHKLFMRQKKELGRRKEIPKNIQRINSDDNYSCKEIKNGRRR